jgi:ATP-binding cassette, subfamily B, multidrug efflux pump
MSSQKKPGNTVTTGSVLKRLLAISWRKAWPLFILLGAGTLAAALLELVPPLVLRRIIDSYLSSGQLNGLGGVAIIYVLALIATSAVGFIQVFVNSYIGQNIILELRSFMAEHLTRLPMSYYSRTPVGDTISRVTADVESINAIFSQTGPGVMGVSNLLTDVVKAVVVLAGIFAISPRLALIVLAGVPIVYLTSTYFRRNTYRTQQLVRKTVGGINTFLQETFSGMRTIKAYGKEDEYASRFQEPLEDNLKAVNSASVYDAYFPCVMQVIRAAVIAAVVWFGAKTGVNETFAISIGSLAAMVDLISRLFNPLDAIAGEFQVLQQARAGFKRIVELLQEKTEEKQEQYPVVTLTKSHRNGQAIEVSGVDFAYSSDQPVLKGVSLGVPHGARVAVVGRTGAGKTTLINLIAGLYKPDKGSILIQGYDPYLVSPSDRRRLVGIVPQGVYIFEGSIKDNITLRDNSIPMEDIEKASRMVGLHEVIISLENGYDTILGVEGTKLSRGQGQLLSLARAVVSDPAVLLLDEPTSGVDTLTEAAIIKAFRQTSENRTIVTISHRLSGILDAEEVHIMGSGRILESGTPEYLAGKGGWYRVYRELESVGWKVD